MLGLAGLANVLYAAYLGGDMVFTKGTGVNHTAWEAGREDYEAVLPLERVEENTLYRVTAAGVSVVLLRQGSQFSAISVTCPHAGGPLDEGTLTGDVVSAPGTARASACAMGACSLVLPPRAHRATMCECAMARWRSSAQVRTNDEGAMCCSTEMSLT